MRPSGTPPSDTVNLLPLTLAALLRSIAIVVNSPAPPSAAAAPRTVRPALRGTSASNVKKSRALLPPLPLASLASAAPSVLPASYSTVKRLCFQSSARSGAPCPSAPPAEAGIVAAAQAAASPLQGGASLLPLPPLGGAHSNCAPSAVAARGESGEQAS
jgi:hypothetical protein